ncbi:MAG: hypothetical protein ACHQAY_17005 [Hyphomicrobiales bacterium]
MAFGTRYREEEEAAPRGITLRWRTLAGVLNVGLGVGAFSVIAGSILADATTERGTGTSKVTWFLSPADREAMRRTAAAALTGDIATGSIKLDPCALPKK